MGSRRCLASFVAASLASAAFAQNTWFVGPGGLPDIPSAITAAAPGDTIVVAAGAYANFHLPKGVTVRAQVPGTVSLSATFPCVVLVPPGENAHLVGLQMSAIVISGAVSVSDCGFTTVNTAAGVGSGGLLVMERCTILIAGATLAPGGALVITQGEAVLVDCSIHVQPALFAATVPITVAAGTLRASRLVVQTAPGSVTPAISADALSQIWLSDSTLTAQATAACAITGGNGRIDRCVLTPACSSLPTGLVLGVHSPQPLQNGATFSVDFTAQPGMAIGVFAAATFAAQTYPDLEQALLLPAASAFALTNVIADPQGVATASWLVPAGPQFVDLTLWVQGFTGFSSPLQASPLVGGVVR